MHQKYVASTEDMSNLPKALRAQMDEEGFVHIEAEMSQESKSDGTIKFLYRLSDGQMIETVFMVIRFVSHRRRAAGWDAVSVRRRLADWYGI